MTTEVNTLPGETKDIGISPPKQGMIRPIQFSSATVLADFEKVSHLLSPKQLRRPRTGYPSGAELKEIAAQHRPPPEWYEGEDDRPF